MPPLRRRREDLVPLIRHFLAELCGKLRAPSVSVAAMKALEQHAWPGNVRELRNVIERALIRQSLSRASGSRTQAARLLGLKRTTLVQKLKRDKRVACCETA